ncbi:unnamed protein product [Cuscuta europaea]|uniref:Uncharacterized protein n=2 Tax=Cuscuta europaea TaxID=41803 RepID=A0A9P0YRR8_CUSEU|nr:unnamed protein product [Cuscuta europaea]
MEALFQEPTMEALFQDPITTSNDFVYNHHHSEQADMIGERFFTSSGSSFSGMTKSATEAEEVVEEEGDYTDATLKFISQMLMDEAEDLEKQGCMFTDCTALQAHEKHFSDALHGSDGDPSPPNGKRTHQHSSPSAVETTYERSNKLQLAEESHEPPLDDDTYYDAIVYPSKKTGKKAGKSNSHRRGGGKKKRNPKEEVIDLRALLTKCAQSIGVNDRGTANETLTKIRLHSSPYGNGSERTAHYLAIALEARMNGTGTSLYSSYHSDSISASDILKGFHTYINAIPFKVVSFMMANKYIMKLTARGATRLHIIDFGILYGFQWPWLIEGLSARAGGPPRLRITGIDFPQPGFRPEERVKATGLRLGKYCERLNVPFEFKAIAKSWESITLEELELERDDDHDDEVLVVNCMDRLGNVADETLVMDCPRDNVLNLIKNINPHVFIHAVVNGTYHTPFFEVRFREALFHFSSLFDMFDATVPREDKDRKLFEEVMLGRDMLNVISCEGTERVERPETYKQWQVRSFRAGFQQLPLDQEIVKFLKEKVRSDYDQNFSMEEEGKWLLQAWKGKVNHAVSYWKPNNN